MEARILLFESRRDDEPSLAPRLEALGARLAACRDRMCLLEQLLGFAPRVVVYAMGKGAPADRAMLEMLRRLAPGVPLAIVTGDAEPETVRLEQELRPLWIGAPDHLEELAAALKAALSLRASPHAP
jgi:hypothetical protein